MKRLNRRLWVSAALTASAVLGGCASAPQCPPPVSTPQDDIEIGDACSMISWEFAVDTYGTLDYVGNGPSAPGSVIDASTGETIGYLLGEDSPAGIANLPQCAS